MSHLRSGQMQQARRRRPRGHRVVAYIFFNMAACFCGDFQTNVHCRQFLVLIRRAIYSRWSSVRYTRFAYRPWRCKISRTVLWWSALSSFSAAVQRFMRMSKVLTLERSSYTVVSIYLCKFSRVTSSTFYPVHAFFLSALVYWYACTNALVSSCKSAHSRQFECGCS